MAILDPIIRKKHGTKAFVKSKALLLLKYTKRQSTTILITKEMHTANIFSDFPPKTEGIKCLKSNSPTGKRAIAVNSARTNAMKISVVCGNFKRKAIDIMTISVDGENILLKLADVLPTS